MEHCDTKKTNHKKRQKQKNKTHTFNPQKKKKAILSETMQRKSTQLEQTSKGRFSVIVK